MNKHSLNAALQAITREPEEVERERWHALEEAERLESIQRECEEARRQKEAAAEEALRAAQQEAKRKEILEFGMYSPSKQPNQCRLVDQ